MDISPSIPVLTNTFLVYDIAAPVRGTGLLIGASAAFALDNVTSNQYTTILQQSFGLEDIGFTVIDSLFAYLLWNVNGNGATIWQISGDGGVTWNTITEVTFNVDVMTAQMRFGTGTWITTVDNGDDKLQIRLRALANAGTVSTQLDDRATIHIQYRQKILITD